MSVLEVPVHHFSWCSCGEQSFPEDHLMIRTSIRRVEPGQAIALSYGIGDFERAMHIFGHSDEATTRHVRLQFGSEWVISDIMKALVVLSEAHGAIWFDQLSITLDIASIALNLQSMPQIYGRFEVIVLLPNAPCKCLRFAVDGWSAGESLYTGKDGDLERDRICWNGFPTSSYHLRLWTKQEFSINRRSVRLSK